MICKQICGFFFQETENNRENQLKLVICSIKLQSNIIRSKRPVSWKFKCKFFYSVIVAARVQLQQQQLLLDLHLPQLVSIKRIFIWFLRIIECIVETFKKEGLGKPLTARFNYLLRHLMQPIRQMTQYEYFRSNETQNKNTCQLRH